MGKGIPITVAHGDGIGPEIMEATLRILEAAGAPLDIERIDIGEKVYLAGNTAGIEPQAWDSLRRTKVFLKAPITTPSSTSAEPTRNFRVTCSPASAEATRTVMTGESTKL